MRQFILAGAAVLVLSATPALAGPPSVNWTGFYVGANVGVGFGHGTTTDDSGYANVGSQVSYDSTDAIGGVQLGYNWQLNQWDHTFVLGVEGDGGYLGFNESTNGFAGNPSGDTYGFGKIGAYGTVRGRLGYAVGNWLPFVTAGVAIGDVKTGAIDACDTGSCGPDLMDAENSGAKVGWAAGAGLEYALTQSWSVKAEYLYLDFGNQDATGTAYFHGNPSTPDGSWKFTTHLTDQLVRIGANYRF